MQSKNHTPIPLHAYTEEWLKLKEENQVLLSMLCGQVEISYTAGHV